jgi:hypothetical protein
VRGDDVLRAEGAEVPDTDSVVTGASGDLVSAVSANRSSRVIAQVDCIWRTIELIWGARVIQGTGKMSEGGTGAQLRWKGSSYDPDENSR